MHIQSYLGEFNSFSSKQQRKVQNIFSNLNRSRKSLTKVYQHKTPQHNDHQTPMNHKTISPSKREDYAFDDNLFHTLYKSHLKVSHQRNNTISGKVDVSKLSFKLNYVQNHRPIIKQKIINKAKQKDESFNINFITEPKTQLKIETKKSKIEKFIKKNQQEQQANDFVRSRRTKKLSIKDIFQKMQQNPPSSNSLIYQYSTLPARRIQSSNTHYDLHNSKTSPANRYHTPQKGKQKHQQLNQLPQYVKNIMKPCKIKGIELINRPLSVGMNKKITGRKNNNMVKVQKQQETDSNIEWNMRFIRTARQSGRNNKYHNPQHETESNLLNSSQLKLNNNKKLIVPEPWNIYTTNEQQQQNMFMFNHRTIN